MENYVLNRLISQEHAGNNINRTFDVAYHKVVWYGDSIFRIKSYELPVIYNFKGVGGRPVKKYYGLEDDETIDLERRRKTEYKIIDTVYGLANVNFNNEKSKFVSLVPAENIVNIQEANKYFRNFIRRVRDIYNYFDYLAVIHFQQENRECVHYHALWNLPYIPQKELLKLWGSGEGSVWINRIYNVDNLGAYTLKYMGKTVGDARLHGNKAYLCSKGLRRPVEKYIDDNELAELVKLYDLENRKPTRKKEYETKNYGKFMEVEYNLKRKGSYEA